MIRGATLVHGLSLFPGRALCRVPSYPRQLTYALTSWNTPWQLIQCSCPGLTTPSAVHLTTCFSPDSQQHGISVQASSPLSPPQRFNLFKYSVVYFVCQYFFYDIFFRTILSFVYLWCYFDGMEGIGGIALNKSCSSTTIPALSHCTIPFFQTKLSAVN